jgi:hypothetical protein
VTNLFSKGKKTKKRVPKQTKTKKKKKQKQNSAIKQKKFCYKTEKKNHSGTTTNQSMKCLMGEPAVNHWGTVGTTTKEHILSWFPKMSTCS